MRLDAVLLLLALAAPAAAGAQDVAAGVPAAAIAASVPETARPAAPVREVRDVLHGVEIADPYRWLEDLESPEAQQYFRAQGEYARAQLDGIPGRPALAARIRELSAAHVEITALALAAGKVFYLKLDAGRQTAMLCVRDGFAGAERVLLDPARPGGEAGPAAIRWFHPSPDGRLVAYGIAPAGTEATVLRVLEVPGGRDTGVAIARTRFNDQLAWHHDSRAFYYAQVPEGGPGDPAYRYAGMRLYRHVIGRPAAQNEIVFASGVGGARDVPEVVFPSLHVPEDSTHAYAVVRDGMRREIAVYMTTMTDLARGLPRWSKVVDYGDGVTAIEAWKDDLYALTHQGASRGKVVTFRAGKSELSRARTVVPEGDAVILDMSLAADALYLRSTVGGLERLERLNFGFGASRTPEFVKTAFDVAISQLITHPRRPGAVLRTQGFIEAPAVLTVEAKTGNLKNTGLQPPPRADFSAIDEVRLYAPTRDGAKVPVTLLYRKTTMLTADNPTLVIGFGAYGRSLVPMFDPTRLAWLENGGIIAFAHIRGGGEYGDDWHRAGRLATKENTISDFIACAEFLIRYGFTSPKRLAIQGTSAGGIPSAGALVRRPDLFAAVVPRGATVDLLRHEFEPGGRADVPEFGSVATREGFEWLRAISAYQQVKDGTPYPAVLFSVGMGDQRASPWQSGKMAARLQAASTSGKPVLLRVDWQAGRGLANTRAQREEELADIYAFLMWQFGRD